MWHFDSVWKSASVIEYEKEEKREYREGVAFFRQFQFFPLYWLCFLIWFSPSLTKMRSSGTEIWIIDDPCSQTIESCVKEAQNFPVIIYWIKLDISTELFITSSMLHDLTRLNFLPPQYLINNKLANIFSRFQPQPRQRNHWFSKGVLHKLWNQKIILLIWRITKIYPDLRKII